MTINDIKQFNTDRGDVDDLVGLLAYGKLIVAEYESLDIDVPEWLPSKLKAVKREVLSRISDQVEKRLKEARLRLDNLKTPAERKTEIQKEIRRLEALAAAKD